MTFYANQEILKTIEFERDRMVQSRRRGARRTNTRRLGFLARLVMATKPASIRAAWKQALQHVAR